MHWSNGARLGFLRFQSLGSSHCTLHLVCTLTVTHVHMLSVMSLASITVTE